MNKFSRKSKHIFVITLLCTMYISSGLFIILFEAQEPYDDPYSNLIRFFSKGWEPQIADIGKVQDIYPDVNKWGEEQRKN